MNFEPSMPLPKISDFPYLQASFLERFCAAYLPDMEHSEVKYCQWHYAKHRRSPKNADELAFLNRLVAGEHRYPENLLLSEMTTDDATLAAAFAHLMAERAARLPNHKTPCSFAEIAAEYLGTAQQNSFSPPLSCRPFPMLALATRKMTPTLLYGKEENELAGGTPISRALACHAPLAEGDRVYAFLAGTDPVENFEKKLLAFAASPLAITRTKRLCPVGERGVFHALRELNMGFEVELPRLYGENASALRLLESENGLLIVAKETEASEMLVDALDIGLRPRLLGRVRKDGYILLKQNDDLCFRFSLHFLSTLTCPRAYRVEPKPRTPRKNAFSLSDSRTVAVERSELLVARAEGDDSHNTVLYATLCVISALAARGVRLDEMHLSHRLTLALDDRSPDRLGQTLSMLLDLYRAVTALPLSAANDGGVMLGASNTFTLYATAEKPRDTLPDTLTRTDSRVYLLEPLYDEKGNPDLEDYQKMLDYVSAQVRNGVIFSARAVVGDLFPTLDAMSGNTAVDYLAPSSTVAKAGAILVESYKELQGILVGKTFVPENIEDLPNADNNA